MTTHSTTNDDSGSLFTGRVKLQPGDAVVIEGEPRPRRVTYVMGSDRNGWRACFARQGAVPRGPVRWRVGGTELPRKAAPERAPSVQAWRCIPLPSVRSATPCLVTGFDSAWTRARRGAIASCLIERRGARLLAEPRAASFDEAAQLIEQLEHQAENPPIHVIVVDQPLVVPNTSARRPVERAIAPLFGRVESGVQPANRSRREMFGDGAPIWDFLDQMRGSISPWSTPPRSGRVVLEAFPALAILGLFPERSDAALPRYNPARPTFSLSDWSTLCRSVGLVLASMKLPSAAAWCDEHAESRPRKPDQDSLDALLCLIVGMLWCLAPERLLVVGDTTSGYVVTPSNDLLRDELRADASRHGVDVRRASDPGPPAPRGSPAAVLAALREPAAVEKGDVDELLRRIEEGRRHARFGSPVR